MDILQFFYAVFGSRIAEHGQYTAVEYLVYGAILLALAFFVIFPILDKKGIKFNAKFLLALLPYILLGSAIHVLEDMHLLLRSPNPLELGYYFVTPGIYLMVAAITLACLFASIAVSKRMKKDFFKIFAGLGLIFALPITAFEIINFQAWLGVLAVIAMVLAATAVLFFLFRALKQKLLQDRLNLLAVASQALDGCATFVATQFFYCGEQHPLSGALLDFFPLSFVLAKIILVLVILWYVDREIKNKNLAGFIKIAIAILGFATGLRDLLTLGVGTCL